MVAHVGLPVDTSYHRSHGHDPLPILPAFQGRPAALGLFAVDTSGSMVARARAPGLRGSLRLTLAPGRYLLSAEVWAPDSLRAGRRREGVEVVAHPPDLPAASDLLLATGQGPDPQDLDELLPLLRSGPVSTGAAFRLAWELHGLGYREERLRYVLEVHDERGGVLRGLGRLLGLVGGGEVVSLEWEEAGPQAPGRVFRSTRVRLPSNTAPGLYRIRLRVRMAGREDLVLERRLRVVGDRPEIPR